MIGLMNSPHFFQPTLEARETPPAPSSADLLS